MPPFFEKLKEAILFVCWHAREMPLGSIRLNKIIFNADRVTFSAQLKPMIFDGYIKGDNGPYLKETGVAVTALKNERMLSVTTVRVGRHKMRIYKALRQPKIKFLSEAEMSTLADLTERICTEYLAAEISEASHNSAWRMASPKERIPLAAQLVCNAVIPTAEVIAWACEEE